MAQPEAKSMPGWARALFIIFGLIVLALAFVCMWRPLVTLELILILVPIALLFNGIGWIIMGFAGRR